MFKIDDTVKCICIGQYDNLLSGAHYQVKAVDNLGNIRLFGSSFWYKSKFFELVEEIKTEHRVVIQPAQEELAIILSDDDIKWLRALLSAPYAYVDIDSAQYVINKVFGVDTNQAITLINYVKGLK